MNPNAHPAPALDMVQLCAEALDAARCHLENSGGPADLTEARDIVAALAPACTQVEHLMKALSLWLDGANAPTRRAGRPRGLASPADRASLSLSCTVRDFRDVANSLRNTADFLARLADGAAA